MNNIEHFNKNHDAHGRFTFGSGIGRAKKALKKEQVHLTFDEQEIKDKDGFINEKKWEKAIKKTANNTKNKKLIEAYREKVKNKNKNVSNVMMEIHFYPDKKNKNKVITTIKPAEKIYKNPYKEIAKNTAKIAGALAAINTIGGLAATASRRMS